MLTIKNLTKHFDNRTIIDHLNLEIPEGKILTIVGPSGGGKTTLLRCLAGLETIDSGELWMVFLSILLKWTMPIKWLGSFSRISNFSLTYQF